MRLAWLSKKGVCVKEGGSLIPQENVIHYLMLLAKIFYLLNTSLDGLHSVQTGPSDLICSPLLTHLWWTNPAIWLWEACSQPKLLRLIMCMENSKGMVPILLRPYSTKLAWFTDVRLVLSPPLSVAVTPSWDWWSWQEVKSCSLWEGQHELQPYSQSSEGTGAQCQRGMWGETRQCGPSLICFQTLSDLIDLE